MSNNNISWLYPWRLLRIGGAVALSVFAAYWGQPLIQGQELAIGMLATAFALLAGVLISVVSLLGDPAMLDQARSWRAAQLNVPILRAQIDRQLVLFYLYLFALFCILASTLAPAGSSMQAWAGRAILFFGTLAALGSISLPGTVRKIQLRRLNAAVEQKMREDGVPQSRILEFRQGPVGKVATQKPATSA